MGDSNSTVWSVVDGAAAGKRADRDRFVRLHSPVLRAYLQARWRGTPLIQDVEDAMQNTFVDCFRDGGALTRVDRERGAFRAFLFGVVRNIAMRHERDAARRPHLPTGIIDLELLASRDAPLSRVFDRAWARAIVRHAAAVYAERAAREGGRPARRAEILQLRFGRDLPIRSIAAELSITPEQAHRDYAAARREFRRILGEVVHGTLDVDTGRVDEKCRKLLDLLGT